MGSMVEIAEDVAGTVVTDVLSEAVAEIGGRSGRKWAVIVLGLVIGGALAAFLLKKLRTAA